MLTFSFREPLIYIKHYSAIIQFLQLILLNMRASRKDNEFDYINVSGGTRAS